MLRLVIGQDLHCLFFYGDTAAGDAWRNEVLYIGWGTRNFVNQKYEEFKEGNNYQQAATHVAYRANIPSTPNYIIRQQLPFFVNMLRLVFCTFADDPNNGGGLFASRCNRAGGTAQAIALPQHFESKLANLYTSGTTVKGATTYYLPSTSLRLCGAQNGEPPIIAPPQQNPYAALIGPCCALQRPS